MRMIGKLTLLEPLTRAKIDDLIASEEVVAVQVERNYTAGDVPGEIALIIPTGVGAGFLDAFKEVNDEASWMHEEDSFVFVVKWKTPENVIDLSESYVRSQKDTSYVGEMGAKMFAVVFSVPSFNGVKSVRCNMTWGVAIAPSEIAKAKTLGIDISGTGASISLGTIPSVGISVAFEKAVGEVGTYIFDDFDFKNKIIGI